MRTIHYLVGVLMGFSLTYVCMNTSYGVISVIFVGFCVWICLGSCINEDKKNNKDKHEN